MLHAPPKPDHNYGVRISEAQEESQWEQFLLQVPGGLHTQSSLWGQVKASLGYKTVRVLVYQNDELVGGAQIVMRSIPLFGAIGYISKGPILRPYSPELADRIVQALKQIAREYNIQLLIAQPPNISEDIVDILQSHGFQPSSNAVSTRATLLLDLQKDLDTILQEMQRKTRYNIRLSGRKGITVREGNEADVNIYYSMLENTSQRQGFAVFPLDYYQNMWRILAPTNNIKLFIAEVDGEPIAAQLSIGFGDTLTNKFSVWSGKHGDKRPNEAIQWAAISWAKEHGYRYYDFEGIDPEAAQLLLQGESIPDDMKQTVTSFKLGFGGDVVDFPEPYDYVYNPVLRKLYENIYPFVQGSKFLRNLLQYVRTRD